jgi:hypothetical protein
MVQKVNAAGVTAQLGRVGAAAKRIEAGHVDTAQRAADPSKTAATGTKPAGGAK